MTKLETLSQQMSACTICQDLPLGPKPLFKLHKDAKIFIAGQAPGSHTHVKGIPFDDPSGNRLRGWLGIDRNTFYNDPRIAILPMGLCFPGTGQSGDLPPGPICAQTWCDKAMAEMPALDLNLIIGRYAIDWHHPNAMKETITNLAQNWQEYWPRDLILPHPSPRNNRWLKQNPFFERDVIPMLQKRIATLLD